jgi:ParB-like chromosome segregation protein Spo0J
MSATNGTDKIIRKRVSSLKPSPENSQLYRPTSEDPDIHRLAERIKKNGCDPLIITSDNYIISGHRRHAALQRIGQKFVECRVLPKKRSDMTTDEYVVLLRSYNEQRNKTIAEQVREELVDINPDEAHRRLLKSRTESINKPERNGVHALTIEGKKKRYGISADKAEHVRIIRKIVFEERRAFWPLSVRGVHYPLLNYDFVRGDYWPRRHEPGHGTKQELRYRNDDGSYDATSDLITRLRLNGTIPWEAFDDPTRPFKEFRAFDDVRRYIRQEIDNLFCGYWRKLLRSQPNHVECVCEKNTVYHMVLRATERYHIPTSSGRGFNSSDAWHDLHERYIQSGKERLIVIVVSDYDPEGEMIPHVGGRTLRDDFGDEGVTIIKAGVTREQIERYNLAKQNFAKETSSNHDWFVERNDGDDSVYELEALNPQDMIDDLENVIKGVIDIDLFNREVAKEKEEAAYLEAAKKTALEAFDAAPDGAIHVITKRRPSAQRWGMLLRRILAKAGIDPWKRIFHNLRASRQTELAAMYPIAAVCRWLGNSVKVADDHYLMGLEKDFEQAAKFGALQNPVQQTATNDAEPRQTITEDSAETLEIAGNAGNSKKFPEACKSQGG